jgi:hypothetical protein
MDEPISIWSQGPQVRQAEGGEGEVGRESDSD